MYRQKLGRTKAVEKTIVTVRELLFERVRCPSEPIYKALSDFLNLGILPSVWRARPATLMVLVSPRNFIRHLLTLIDVGNGIV